MCLRRYCLVTGITFALFVVNNLLQPEMGLSDIIDIDPFVGSHSEDYNDISGVSHQQLSVMDGFANLTNLTAGGAIKIEMSSSFNGDLVVPRSSPRMLGQLGILRWDFASPLSQFGSYFENNSGTDDAVIEFFTSGGVLLGTRNVNTSTSSQQWTWNGWQSDIPFSTIIVTGNSNQFLNGFIWYDDTQATAAMVPEPLAWLCILPFSGLLLARRNRKRFAGSPIP